MTMNRNGISNIDSNTIAWLRLPLAIGVVFIHLCMGLSGKNINWTDFSGMDGYRLFECFVTNELASLAVPLFFVISGYLFFINFKADSFGEMIHTYWGKLKSRCRSLLLPYVIFNALAIIGLIVNYMIQGHSLTDASNMYLSGMKWLHAFWDIHTTGTSTNLLGITKAVAYPINSPLWFVRDLMVLIILSPLLYYTIKKLRWGWLILMVALTLTGIWIPLPGFGVSSCLFFSIGAWFAISGLSLGQSLARWRWMLLAIALPAMAGDIVCDGTDWDKYCHVLALISGLFAIFAFVARKQPRQSAPKWSAQASFFIFAVHTLPIPFLGSKPVEFCKGLIWTNSDNGILCVLQFIGAGLSTAIICLIAFLILRCIAPTFINLITGRKTK